MTLGILQQPWPKVPDDRQNRRIVAIREACEMLRMIMHESEGSALPGEHQEHEFISKRMKRAADMLELVEMLSVKAALE